MKHQAKFDEFIDRIGGESNLDECWDRVYFENAGLWAEFGKIICISMGYFDYEGNKRITTLSEESEIGAKISFYL